MPYDYNYYNDYRDSNLDLGQQTLVDTSRHQQTDRDLDSICNSCDVFLDACIPSEQDYTEACDGHTIPREEGEGPKTISQA